MWTSQKGQQPRSIDCHARIELFVPCLCQVFNEIIKPITTRSSMELTVVVTCTYV